MEDGLHLNHTLTSFGDDDDDNINNNDDDNNNNHDDDRVLSKRKIKAF